MTHSNQVNKNFDVIPLVNINKGRSLAPKINWAERFTEMKPTWHDTEKTAKIAGKVLIALGVAFAIAGAATGFAFFAIPLAFVGFIGIFGIASAICIGFGAGMVNQQSWVKDPAYLRKMGQQIENDIVSGEIEFNDIAQKYGQLIASLNIFTNQDYLRNDAYRLTFNEFIQKHGVQAGENLDQETANLLAHKAFTQLSIPELNEIIAPEDWGHFVGLLDSNQRDSFKYKVLYWINENPRLNFDNYQDLFRTLDIDCKNNRARSFAEKAVSLDEFNNISNDPVLQPTRVNNNNAPNIKKNVAQNRDSKLDKASKVRKVKPESNPTSKILHSKKEWRPKNPNVNEVVTDTNVISVNPTLKVDDKVVTERREKTLRRANRNLKELNKSKEALQKKSFTVLNNTQDLKAHDAQPFLPKAAQTEVNAPNIVVNVLQPKIEKEKVMVKAKSILERVTPSVAVSQKANVNVNSPTIIKVTNVTKKTTQQPKIVKSFIGSHRVAPVVSQPKPSDVKLSENDLRLKALQNIRKLPSTYSLKEFIESKSSDYNLVKDDLKSVYPYFLVNAKLQLKQLSFQEFKVEFPGDFLKYLGAVAPYDIKNKFFEQPYKVMVNSKDDLKALKISQAEIETALINDLKKADSYAAFRKKHGLNALHLPLENLKTLQKQAFDKFKNTCHLSSADEFIKCTDDFAGLGVDFQSALSQRWKLIKVSFSNYQAEMYYDLDKVALLNKRPNEFVKCISIDQISNGLVKSIPLDQLFRVYLNQINNAQDKQAFERELRQVADKKLDLEIGKLKTLEDVIQTFSSNVIPYLTPQMPALNQLLGNYASQFDTIKELSADEFLEQFYPVISANIPRINHLVNSYAAKFKTLQALLDKPVTTQFLSILSSDVPGIEELVQKYVRDNAESILKGSLGLLKFGQNSFCSKKLQNTIKAFQPKMAKALRTSLLLPVQQERQAIKKVVDDFLIKLYGVEQIDQFEGFFPLEAHSAIDVNDIYNEDAPQTQPTGFLNTIKGALKRTPNAQALSSAVVNKAEVDKLVDEFEPIELNEAPFVAKVDLDSDLEDFVEIPANSEND
ncbi:MAG: DUF3784 domain-containing protein [Parachlamydiales bacterium]|nr:DUF3784 domain-containing protein [Parachlamydiales bacterium]